MTFIIGAGKITPLWQDWERTQRENAALSVGRLEVTQRKIAEASRLDARTLRSTGTTDPRQLIMVEPNLSIAGARLAEIVTSASEKAALRITSLQMRPDTAFKERFARVGVRLVASGDVQSLVDLLQALDRKTPVLSVRELSVTPSDPMSADARPEILRFQLLVEVLAFSGGERIR